MSKWEMVRLGDVCNILDHMRIPITASQRTKGDYPYFGANGVQDYINDYIFDDELVLLAEDGGNFGSREKPIAYRISGKCWVNNHAHVLKPKSMLDVDYLCYSIMFYDVSSLISGTTRAKLNQASMRRMRIPLPSLEVQRKIADVLDRAAALIEKRKTQIEKLDLLIKSRFIKMFGDPVTNTLKWNKQPLGEYIVFLTSGSRGWSSFFRHEGSIFLTIKNVKQSNIVLTDVQYVLPPDNKEAARTKVQENDLLISITADLGRTAVVPASVAEHGAYINQHLSLVRLDLARIHPLYVSHYLESPGGKLQFAAKDQVGVKSGLNFEAIKSLVIQTPPMELQCEFAAFVTQLETQRRMMQQSLIKIKRLYSSLTQKCFRGEIF